MKHLGTAVRSQAIGLSACLAIPHRGHIMAKLGLHGVSELVRYAIRNAIIGA